MVKKNGSFLVLNYQIFLDSEEILTRDESRFFLLQKIFFSFSTNFDRFDSNPILLKTFTDRPEFSQICLMKLPLQFWFSFLCLFPFSQLLISKVLFCLSFQSRNQSITHSYFNNWPFSSSIFSSDCMYIVVHLCLWNCFILNQCTQGI